MKYSLWRYSSSNKILSTIKLAFILNYFIDVRECNKILNNLQNKRKKIYQDKSLFDNPSYYGMENDKIDTLPLIY